MIQGERDGFMGARMLKVKLWKSISVIEDWDVYRFS